MEQLSDILGTLSGFIWGPVMLVLLLGAGLYLTIGLKAMPWRRIPRAFTLLWQGREGKEEYRFTRR